MKKTIYILAFVLLCSLSLEAQSFQDKIPESYGYRVKLGQTVPDFTLELPDGSQTTMRALRGKVVMLQFTASWCSVCRKEMPHIENEIWQKHKDRADFALYGIDLKEDRETVMAFQKDTKISYPIALDVDGDIFYTFAEENAGVTRNVIIDKEGKIAYMTRLFKQEEFDQMKATIEELLKP